jgi:hypothetical protein
VSDNISLQFEESSESPQSFFQGQDGGAWDGDGEDDDTQVSEMLQTILQSFIPSARVTVESSTARPPDTLGPSDPLTQPSSSLGQDSDSNSENENGDNQREGQDTVRIMQLMK